MARLTNWCRERSAAWWIVASNCASIGFIALCEIVNWLVGFGGFAALFDARTGALFTIGINVLNILLQTIRKRGAGPPWGRQ